MRKSYIRTPLTESKRLASRAARLFRTQRYHVRANFLGVINYVCPCCGLIGRARLFQRRYWFRCSVCRAKFIPQINLMLIPPGGRKSIPADFIIPDEKGRTALQEAFPLGDLTYWKQGGCVHSMTVSGRYVDGVGVDELEEREEREERE